jgi:hypothetical protein
MITKAKSAPSAENQRVETGSDIGKDATLGSNEGVRTWLAAIFAI